MEALLQLNVHKYKVLFIFWNIFLALIPCFTVYYMSKAKSVKRTSLTFVVLFLFWLFMLPNTAYLFFMVRHLVNYCSDYDTSRVCADGSWMVMFFFTYAIIGIPTFYYALRKMTDLVSKLYWDVCSEIFPLVIIPLTSIGLLLGLYERNNSWDLLTNPLAVLKTAGGYFSDPIMLRDFLIFTFVLYLIYFTTNFLVKHD